MAVLGRVLVGSSERLDLVDLLSMDSFTAADFKFLLQSFVGSSVPYVLAGCEVSNPGDAIGTESVAINIHDSVVYHPTSTAGPFFYGLEEGNSNAAPLIPELRKNATNFVYLTFDTFDTAQDSRAFWDPDQNGGEGSEFSQDVNTESVLKLEVGVSVATFPEGTIPIAKITLNASVITSIQDSRNMMFRLGTGGVSPDPFSDFDFRSLPDQSYQRTEPSTTMSSSTSPNAFQGGDKNILTFKEWMDVVMTKLKELGNTTYWYESASSSGGGSGSAAASTSFLKSKGQWVHSDATPGQVEFTEDITSINLIDPRSIIFRASTKPLSDDQVLYADLIDGAEINTAGDPVDWINGGYFVSSQSAGRFANLSKGDWIKKKTDTNDKWLRVEEFYTGEFGGGSGGQPTNALSILLSDAYQGSSTYPGPGASAEYSKGVYDGSELTISTRGSAALQSLTGSFFWLAARSDVIHTISNITATTLVIDTITEADGVRARCYDASGHGLEDGYRITIDAGVYAGTHKVEVEDDEVFYINTAATGDEASVNSYYGIATMTVRQSDDDNGGGKVYTGIDLESDTHNLDNDQSIIISGTTNYDGSFLITVPPPTVTDFAKKIQIPLPSAPALENEGLATLPRMSVRDEFGITKIVQGQSTDIGDGTADAIKDYIGWTGSSTPDYFTSLNGSGYNAKDGMSNYNTDENDNLTTRAAKLTAMMADRVQDRGLMFDGITTITNTAGTDITASATIDLIKPGSTTQTITLTTGSIVANSAIVATMNRNGSGAMATSVEPLNNNFTLEENKLILFYRLSTTDIYTWDGIVIPAGETHTYGERLRPRLYTEQDRTLQLIKGGTWSWDAITGGGTLTWDANAFIQVPGIADASNQIDTGSQASIADGNILTISIDRVTGTNSLAIVNSAVAATTLSEDTVVLARRVGTSIIIGDLITLKDGESSDLIEDTTDQTQRDMQQNLNAKLVKGGTWHWDLATTTLSWSADANIAIPSLANSVNVIPAGNSALLTSDDRILYINAINRSGAGGSLSLSGGLIGSVALNNDTLTIARRVGNDVLIGNSFLLKDGEYLELDGALAEINRLLGQLRLEKTTNTNELNIASADVSLLDGESLIQELDDLVVDFSGSLINFTAGTASTSITGLSAIATEIPTDTHYKWFGIALASNTIGADNKITPTIQVTPAASTDAVQGNAVLPEIKGTKKLGAVLVQRSGANAIVVSISRLGTGSGGGGGAEVVAIESTLANNQLTMADVTDFLIDKDSNTGFSTEYSIHRRHDEYGGGELTDVNARIGANFGNTVSVVKVLDDGSMLVGGNFINFGAGNIDYLCKLNADGTEDATFNANVGNNFLNQIFDIVVLSDGSIVVGGDFTAFGASIADYACKLNADGTEDAAFNLNIGSNFDNLVSSIDITSDDSIIAGGFFTNFGVNNADSLCKLNADGTENAAFNLNIAGNLSSYVQYINVLSDDTVLVGGDFLSFGVNNAHRFCKLNADGTEDAAFNLNISSSFSSVVASIRVLDDNTILVGGSFLNLGVNNADRLCKLNADGTENAAFNLNIAGNFDNVVRSIDVSSDGSILVGGFFLNFGVNNADKLCKLNADGTEDAAFNLNIAGNLSGNLYSVNVLDDDTLIIGGEFLNFGVADADRLCKLNADGTEEVIFNANVVGNFNGSVYSIKELNDGSIMIAGGFTNFGVNNAGRLCKLNADGTENAAFNANIAGNFNSLVTAIEILSDGSILACGYFTSLGVNNANYVCKLNADGTEDAAFNLNIATNFSGTMRNIKALSDGSIIVCGTFNNFGVNNADRLCKLNADGTEDAAFNANIAGNIGGTVEGLDILNDDSILFGGYFTNFGVNIADRIAKINADGTEDAAFNANIAGNFGGVVRTIKASSDDTILAGGDFTSFGTNSADRLCKLNADGTEDAAFNLNIASNFGGTVRAIDILDNGSILVGGSFITFGINNTDYLCQLNADGSEDTNVNANIVSSFSSTMRVINILSDNTAFVGGDFTTYGVSNNNNLAKISLTEVFVSRKQGTLRGYYDDYTSLWNIGETDYIGDDVGITLDMTSSGQLQYTSTDIDGTVIDSYIRFLTKGL